MDVGKKIEGVDDAGSGGLAGRHVVHEPNKGRGTKSVASLPWQGSKDRCRGLDQTETTLEVLGLDAVLCVLCNVWPKLAA